MRRSSIGISVLLIALMAIAQPADANQKFKSCLELRKKYAYGISLSSKSINKGPGPIEKPRVSAAIYRANKSKDTDKDGIVCEVVKKTTNAAPVPEAPLSLDNLDVNRVRQAAYKEVLSGIQSSASFSPNIIFVIGPSLSESRVASERAGLNMASSFWSDIYKPSQIFIGYVTERDVDWVDNAYCEKARYCPTGNNVVVSQVIRNDLPYCSSAQATRNLDGMPFFNQCLGNGSTGLKNKQTGPHEYTHFVQADVSSMHPSVPNWWTEGSADYFGGAIGAYDGTSYPSTLNQMVHTSAYNWVQQDLCDLKTVTESAVTACFKYTYRQASPPAAGSRWMLAHVSYYQGALATEALIAVYGLPKVKQFMIDIRSKGFESAFTDSFGLTSDVFYEKVSKYVVAMYKLGR